MNTVIINCTFCGKQSARRAADVNRAAMIGAPLFCNSTCFGLSRRQYKSAEQRKAEKALYDRRYRSENIERITANKAAYFRRTYDPSAAAIERKKRAPQHAEYCRRPEYRAWKAEYDAKRRAEVYGEYAESYRLILTLERECLSRMSRYEIGLANGTLNKATQRRREYERSFSD
jgi:hypothetical protein